MGHGLTFVNLCVAILYAAAVMFMAARLTENGELIAKQTAEVAASTGRQFDCTITDIHQQSGADHYTVSYFVNLLIDSGDVEQFFTRHDDGSWLGLISQEVYNLPTSYFLPLQSIKPCWSQNVLSKMVVVEKRSAVDEYLSTSSFWLWTIFFYTLVVAVVYASACCHYQQSSSREQNRTREQQADPEKSVAV